MLKAHTGTVRGVCFSSDGRMLATCSDDKTIKVGQGLYGVRRGGHLLGRQGQRCGIGVLHCASIK